MTENKTNPLPLRGVKYPANSIGLKPVRSIMHKISTGVHESVKYWLQGVVPITYNALQLSSLITHLTGVL